MRLLAQARERPACPKLLDFPCYDQKIRALGDESGIRQVAFVPGRNLKRECGH